MQVEILKSKYLAELTRVDQKIASHFQKVVIAACSKSAKMRSNALSNFYSAAPFYASTPRKTEYQET